MKNNDIARLLQGPIRLRWSKAHPRKPGDYFFRCGENAYKPELIRVYFGRPGELWVQCPDLGKMPIKHYHDGLSDPTWKQKPLERGCPFDEELPLPSPHASNSDAKQTL